MPKIQQLLLLAAQLTLITYPSFTTASPEDTPVKVTVELNSTRPLPSDLRPVILNDHLPEEIQLFRNGFQSVVEMDPLTSNTYSAQVPWDVSTATLAIDHPGYLRGFTTVISLTDSKTQPVDLPQPGSLYATLDLQHIRRGPRPQNAKDPEYIITSFTSFLTPLSSHTYKIHNPELPVTDWNLQYDDLAPGSYRIVAYGRRSLNGASMRNVGPEIISGRAEFSIQSQHRTHLSFPIFARGESNLSETTSSTISIKKFQGGLTLK